MDHYTSPKRRIDDQDCFITDGPSPKAPRLCSNSHDLVDTINNDPDDEDLPYGRLTWRPPRLQESGSQSLVQTERQGRILSRAQSPPTASIDSHQPVRRRATRQRNTNHAILCHDIELESARHNGMELRPRKCVELADQQEFLRIDKISNRRISRSTDGLVIQSDTFLAGQIFKRTRILHSLHKKVNEVARTELYAEAISVEQVLGIRRLIITNASFPQFNPRFRDGKFDNEGEDILVCRWVWGMGDKFEGYTRRITEQEADEGYRIPDELLREQWRGAKLDMHLLTQSGLTGRNHAPQSEYRGEMNGKSADFDIFRMNANSENKMSESRDSTYATSKDENSRQAVNRLDSLQARSGPLSQSRYSENPTFSAAFRSLSVAVEPASVTRNDERISENTQFVADALQESHTRDLASNRRQSDRIDHTLTAYSPSNPDFERRRPSSVFSNDNNRHESLPAETHAYLTAESNFGFRSRTLDQWRPTRDSSSSFHLGRNSATFLAGLESSVRRMPPRSSSVRDIQHQSRSSPLRSPLVHSPLYYYDNGEDDEFASISDSELDYDKPTRSHIKASLTATENHVRPITLLEYVPVVDLTSASTLKYTSPNQDPITKYTFGDAFCGAGGTSCGARWAGLQIRWGVDRNIPAITAFHANYPEAKAYALSIDEFLQTEHDTLVDIVHLSPPCQPYSPAHTIMGKDDEENQAALFAVSLTLLHCRARLATIEQTTGLVNHVEYFRGLMRQFTDLGWSIKYKILKAIEHGVPQNRKRLFVIAAAPGEALPAWPEPSHSFAKNPTPPLKPPVTVYDVIFDIPADAKDMDDRTLFTIPKAPWDPHVFFNRTIMAGGGSYDIHPLGHRGFTTRELACLQSFPVDYVFAGKGGEKRRQVGNAVPPALSLAVMRELVKHLKKCDARRKCCGYTDTNRRAREIPNNHLVVDVEPRVDDDDEVQYLDRPPSSAPTALQSLSDNYRTDYLEHPDIHSCYEIASVDGDNNDPIALDDDDDSEVVEMLQDEGLDGVEDLAQEVEMIVLDDPADTAEFIADENGNETRDPIAHSTRINSEVSQPPNNYRRRRVRQPALAHGLRTILWEGEPVEVSNEISDEEFIELMEAARDIDQRHEHEHEDLRNSPKRSAELFAPSEDPFVLQSTPYLLHEPQDQPTGGPNCDGNFLEILDDENDVGVSDSITVIDEETEELSKDIVLDNGTEYVEEPNKNDYENTFYQPATIMTRQVTLSPCPQQSASLNSLSGQPWRLLAESRSSSTVPTAQNSEDESDDRVIFVGSNLRSHSRTIAPVRNSPRPSRPSSSSPAFRPHQSTGFKDSGVGLVPLPQAHSYLNDGSSPSDADIISDGESLPRSTKAMLIYDEEDVDDGDENDAKPLMGVRRSAPVLTSREPIELSDGEDDDVVQTGIYYRDI